MIYKYKRYLEEGVNGFVLMLKGTQEVQPSYLGEIDGWEYAYLPEAVEQDERIQSSIVELSTTEKEELRKQRFTDVRKLAARSHINSDIGDVYDLVADAMKLIEFNMMLTARLAGDLWGTNPIEEAKKAEYAGRNKAFLDAVEAGDITLRGDFEDMDTVMARLMGRVSTINELVRDHYVSELQKVGL